MADFPKPSPGLKPIPVYHTFVTHSSLRPLEVPPEITETLPSFPFSSRTSLLDTTYTRSTHFVPAAFPRSIPDLPPTPPPAWSENKEEYKVNVQKTIDECIARRVEFLKSSADVVGSRKRLYACVSRFVRKFDTKKREPGLTCFVTHATGFGKEVSASI